jgi:hypothetical protein
MSPRPVDIRDVPPDQHWEQFEQQWTALLSYRYLGVEHSNLDASVDKETMTLRHDMRNDTGGIMVTPLCLLAPETGGFSDENAIPNPVIASMHILDDCRDLSELALVRETIRVGRTNGFSRSQIVDAADPTRVIALSEGMGVSLGSVPAGYEKVENPPIEVEDSPSMPPLRDVFGVTRRPDGNWVLPELQSEFASPDAALHIGPQHIVLETAATEMAQDLANSDVQIENWHVMFVARGKIGPFRAEGSVHGGPDHRIGCQLTLHDEGNDDRAVSSVTASFRPVS